MKLRICILLSSILILAGTGCNNSKPSIDTETPAQQPAAASGYTGTVVETMNAAGYTYVLLDTGTERIWAAGPECTVKIGEKISIPQGMLKENFNSKTLNRTFEKIYFVESIMPLTGGKAACTVPQEQGMDGKSRTVAPRPADINFQDIKKPAGGRSVAEIYQGKKTLAGKRVRLCGKVVKFNAEIMNKNWAHVQDGTGPVGANDLTVVTADSAKVGDTVLVDGVVVLDKDFGFGYKYDVLIDNATLRMQE